MSDIRARINPAPVTRFDKAHPIELRIPVGGRTQSISMDADQARVLWNDLQAVMWEMQKAEGGK